MVEFVLVFPAVLAILFGCIQAMMLLFQKSLLDDAIEEVATRLERSTNICEDISASELNSIDSGHILPRLSEISSIFMTSVIFRHDGTDVTAVPCIDPTDDDNNQKKIVLNLNYTLRCMVCQPLSLGALGSNIPFSSRHLLRPETFGPEQTCLSTLDAGSTLCSEVP